MSTTVGKPRIDRDKIVAGVTLSALIGQDQQIVRDGREFKTMCPWHRDTNPSLTINDDKAFYHCFACGAHGTAIDWLQFQRGVDFRTACEELAALSSLAILPAPKAPRLKRQGADYKAIVPVPPEIATPDFEIGAVEGKPPLGPPIRVWTYRDERGQLLGYVARYRNDPTTGKKEVRTWTYGSYPDSERAYERVIRWRVRRWERPYPLYGLWKLGDPDVDSKRIIIVSGEKCVDALQTILPNDIVLTWVGGDDGVAHADWSPLCARQNIIVFWPDADESGRRAMSWIADELEPLLPGDRYLINVDDAELPKGWDCADAIEEEGKDAAWFGEFIREMMPDEQPRIRKIPRARPGALVPPKPVQEPEPPTKDVERPAQLTGMEWWQQPWADRLIKTKSDTPQLIKCEFNAAVPLREDADLKGRIRFNMVRGIIEIVDVLPWGDGPGEWRDHNLTGLCQWLNLMRFHMGKEMMQDAIDRVAYENRFNPLLDYLEGLTWDGVPRVGRWLPVYTGCEDTMYTREVGKRWLIGAAARAARPGCQVDTMLVLESGEGKYKTSLLRALGGGYFTPLRGDIGSSDGRCSVQAATNWIIEFSELAALNKVSFEALKDFLTTTDEVLRLPYRRNPERVFRVGVFAGTTNESEWLPMDGDHRRFWPVRIKFCDVDAVRRDRDQLWAEAYHLYKQQEKWWIGYEEIDLIRSVADQRDERRFHDEWFSQVVSWASKPMNRIEKQFSLADIARGALGVERDKLDKNTQMRIGKILQAAGWKRWKARSEEGVVWVWRRPEAPNEFD